MPDNLKRNIFVVDDEPAIAMSLAAILNASGFQATSFTDPEMALRVAETSKPSLLITDVMMPQMNGIQLAVQVQSVCPDCKVLLFSGQASTGNLLGSAKESGLYFQLLEKPIHPKDLIETIKKL